MICQLINGTLHPASSGGKLRFEFEDALIGSSQERDGRLGSDGLDRPLWLGSALFVVEFGSHKKG